MLNIDSDLCKRRDINVGRSGTVVESVSWSCDGVFLHSFDYQCVLDVHHLVMIYLWPKRGDVKLANCYACICEVFNVQPDYIVWY